jgi:glycosyltransferase involved in cell wall biosynthesis
MSRNVPENVSIVVPAFEESPSIGPLVSALRAAAAWREIIVVDDGSADETGRRAAEAGARVVRHPYNKGNGASVKTGIRNASGEFVLILDADGQHQPADACRLIAKLAEYELVVGARSGATQAGFSRRIGNALLNGMASYLTSRRIPDLTSGFRAARRSHLRRLPG